MEEIIKKLLSEKAFLITKADNISYPDDNTIF